MERATYHLPVIQNEKEQTLKTKTNWKHSGNNSWYRNTRINTKEDIAETVSTLKERMQETLKLATTQIRITFQAASLQRKKNKPKPEEYTDPCQRRNCLHGEHNMGRYFPKRCKTAQTVIIKKQGKPFHQLRTHKLVVVNQQNSGKKRW